MPVAAPAWPTYRVRALTTAPGWTVSSPVVPAASATLRTPATVAVAPLPTVTAAASAADWPTVQL